METGPLDINATIVGPVVELRYSSHGEAMQQLHTLRRMLAQRTELLESMREVIRISDRKHEAWDRAKAAIAEVEATEGRGISTKHTGPAELLAILERIIKCDDDARAARGNPRANLNGYGLVDLFDSVGNPFGAGAHKQQPYRSCELDCALIDARAAIAKTTGSAT